MEKTIYITSPIYYINSYLHIGHVYTNLVCDCLTRYYKMINRDVFFLTGTDEHGKKIEEASKKKNKNPKEFADEMSDHFKICFKQLNFEYDRFIRTTDEDHNLIVINLWNQMINNGDIYMGKYDGWYSVSDETYVTASMISDGYDISTNEPCKIYSETGNKVTKIEEENYMFRLSKYQDKILNWLEEYEPITPKFRNKEMISFVKAGLQDLSVSRKSSVTSWGIPVPANNDHVIYVWLDALANYITGSNIENKNIFPADIHVVGKDILKFHAVYWIGFLMSLNFPLPKKIVAHGWWLAKKNNSNGEFLKMSKSIGNVINPISLSNKYGNDVLKYYLLRESSFNSDSEYSEDILISRLNSDLANNLGNLVMRCLSKKISFDGKIIKKPDENEYEESDKILINKILECIKKCHEFMSIPDIQKYIECIWNFMSEFNTYITEQKPWDLVKNNQERFAVVHYCMLELLRIVSILISPVLIDASNKIKEYLNISENNLEYGIFDAGHCFKTEVQALFQKVFIKK